jgi:hypothetical protein
MRIFLRMQVLRSYFADEDFDHKYKTKKQKQGIKSELSANMGQLKLRK